MIITILGTCFTLESKDLEPFSLNPQERFRDEVGRIYTDAAFE